MSGTQMVDMKHFCRVSELTEQCVLYIILEDRLRKHFLISKFPKLETKKRQCRQKFTGIVPGVNIYQ